jgi:hypothetical protein
MKSGESRISRQPRPATQTILPMGGRAGRGLVPNQNVLFRTFLPTRR